MKIGIITSSPLFFFGPYSKQALILIKFFINNNNIFFLSHAYSHSNKKKDPHILSIKDIINKQFDAKEYSNNKHIIDKINFIGFYCDTNFSISAINKCIDTFKLDKIITILDLLRIVVDDHCFNCECISWFPNHYNPVDNNSLYILKIIDKIVTLSTDGHNILKKKLQHKYITSIPHVIDIKPSLKNKDDIRQEFNIPNDKFLICIVGGNYEINNRRSLDTSILAFYEFYKEYPNSYLYIQSLTYDNLNFINDLHRIIQYIDLPIESYNINQTKIDHSKILEIYKMADICLFGSKSEGFGIPNIEAQLCGSTVITNNFGALKEYTLNGISVNPTQLQYDHIGDGIWSMPSIEGLKNAMIYIKNYPISNKESNIQTLKYKTSYNTVKEQFNYILPIKPIQQELIDIIIKLPSVGESKYIKVNRKTYKDLIRNPFLITEIDKYNKKDILKHIYAPLILLIDIKCVVDINWIDKIPQKYSSKVIKPCVILKTNYNNTTLSNNDKIFILVESKYLNKMNELDISYIIKTIKHLNIPLIMSDYVVNHYR